MSGALGVMVIIFLTRYGMPAPESVRLKCGKAVLDYPPGGTGIVLG